jgi:hypothetical protein
LIDLFLDIILNTSKRWRVCELFFERRCLYDKSTTFPYTLSLYLSLSLSHTHINKYTQAEIVQVHANQFSGIHDTASAISVRGRVAAVAFLLPTATFKEAAHVSEHYFVVSMWLTQLRVLKSRAAVIWVLL